MKVKFITIQEIDIKEGDLLKYTGTTIKNDYFIFADVGVGYTLISLKNGNRYVDPCSREELKVKIEKDGNFAYFGKLNFEGETTQTNEN